tara:strand:+ start:330 stop:1106 length:777 start_codon:yes stop_codon:yes gene_type:complete
MKKALLLSIAILFSSCNTNPDYAKNLATAKKLFKLHEEENLEAQLALVSEKIESNTSFYGSETVGYDQYVSMLKGYHAAFDNIKYTANNWLPGTSPEGKLDGSVRTYGTWTGVNIATGKELDLKGYWYMNFDKEGKIIAQGDFFDFGGMIDAVYPKNLVFIQIEVLKGKKQQVLDILNSDGGLPATIAFDGCISYEMAFNEETNTFHLVGNWESYEKYDAYLKWRQTEDTVIGKMIPYLKGGEKGLKIASSNTNYQAF